MDGVALIAVVAGAFGLGFLLGFITFRVLGGGRERPPRCAKCGYPVAGLETLRCPECGSDLREVGIKAARGQRRLHPMALPLVFLIGWTVIVPALAILLAPTVASLFPRMKVDTHTSVMLADAARFDITILRTGREDQPPIIHSASILVDPGDGAGPPPLQFDPDGLTPAETRILVREWLADSGITVQPRSVAGRGRGRGVVDEDSAMEATAAAVAANVMQFAGQSGPANAMGGAFLSLVSTKGDTSFEPRHWSFVFGVPGFWFLVWLIPIGIVFHRARKQRRVAASPPRLPPHRQAVCAASSRAGFRLHAQHRVQQGADDREHRHHDEPLGSL